VRYFAAATEAAGREDETIDGAATVGELRGLLIERYGVPMARVLANGSFLIDGIVSRDDSASLGSRADPPMPARHSCAQLQPRRELIRGFIRYPSYVRAFESCGDYVPASRPQPRPRQHSSVPAELCFAPG